MSWIKTITYAEATGRLKQLYDRVKGPDNNVDNVLSIHSLRPHTLTAHMGLYKAVIHHSGNTLPKWFLETLGVYVSKLNRCDYCVSHHSEGLKRLRDEPEFLAIMDCIQNDQPSNHFKGKWLAGMEHAKLLTNDLHQVDEGAINKLKSVAFTDGEILEINQLVSYFNYVNRTVLGLGVNTSGDILGLSPNNNQDPNNWSHA